MKKLFAILAVTAAFAACNNGGETPAAPAVDSTKIKDSIAAAAKAAADTAAKAVADTTKKAVADTAKAADKMEPKKEEKK